MSDKNFVNFHILVSHNPSNLNRDDMGMQKTAIFGGVKRTRISSQSLKRAIRKSDYYKKQLEEISIRTKELPKLFEKIKEELKGKVEDKWIKKTIEVLSGNKVEETDEATSVWSMTECQYICEKIKDIYENPSNEEEKQLKENFEKLEKITDKKKRRKPENEIKDYLRNNVDFHKKLGKTTDIALSGRMTTSGIMTSVDGSLAVAHVITTHGVDNEIDWFTAVDDLKQEEDSEDKGSAHLDTTEFSSGVFYRYASLNLRQLQKNLGEENNRKEALKIASHVLHLLVTVTPSAKQQSFAAHNMADFALVTFSGQPLSLANAFETPVKDDNLKEGLLKPSVRALLAYQKDIEVAYELKQDPKGFYSIRHCYEHKNHKDKLHIHTENLLDCKTLEELKTWIQKDAKIK